MAPSCVESDISYRSGVDNATFTVKGPRGCNELCQKTKYCKHWTVDKGDGDQLCTLTDQILTRRPHAETVSGTMNCKSGKLNAIVRDFLASSIGKINVILSQAGTLIHIISHADHNQL